MSNSLIFKNENFGAVRIAYENNEPLFCLSNICKILDLSNNRMVAEAIKSEFEVCKYNLHTLKTNGGIQNFIMIDEPQLYFVLNNSRSLNFTNNKSY